MFSFFFLIIIIFFVCQIFNFLPAMFCVHSCLQKVVLAVILLIGFFFFSFFLLNPVWIPLSPELWWLVTDWMFQHSLALSSLCSTHEETQVEAATRYFGISYMVALCHIGLLCSWAETMSVLLTLSTATWCTVFGVYSEAEINFAI